MVYSAKANSWQIKREIREILQQKKHSINLIILSYFSREVVLLSVTAIMAEVSTGATNPQVSMTPEDL